MVRFNWPIIGHKKIIDYLQTVIQNDRVNHGYLFYGQNGLGKNKVADYFIKSIFCLSQDIKPCGTCSHCGQLQKAVHADVIYLDKDEDKKNITVEQVREMREKVQHSSFLNSYKMVVIRDANALSLSASNAMLKILEEPTGKTVFILIAENLKNIPETVISRVQAIEFLPVARTEIERYLISIGKGKEEAYEFSRLSAGLPDRILKLIEHKKIVAEYKDKIRKIVENLLGDINNRFNLIEKLAGQNKSESAKVEAEIFLDNLTMLVRDSFLLKNMCFNQAANVWLQDKLSDMGNKYDNLKFVQILEKIKRTKEYIRRNVNLRLALENLMLEF
ncbi:MAG: DNA polymerase III subunit [Candidatus Kuenenbacteria bacterium]